MLTVRSRYSDVAVKLQVGDIRFLFFVGLTEVLTGFQMAEGNSLRNMFRADELFLIEVGNGS